MQLVTVFPCVFQAILIFCWVYVRKYQSRRESEVISTITAIFALAVALISSALLPVDIFLVSYMKNQNGTFKVWTSKNINCVFERTTFLVLSKCLIPVLMPVLVLEFHCNCNALFRLFIWTGFQFPLLFFRFIPARFSKFYSFMKAHSLCCTTNVHLPSLSCK